MKLHKILILIIAVVCSHSAMAQEYLPKWSEGMLDLHFIATGRGDSSFYVLPDGTKILCDAGDVGEIWHVAQPNASMMPGEWISKYIKDFSKDLPGKTDVVDYFYLTHFHGDHMGSYKNYKEGPHGYPLSGITLVGEEIHFNKIINRDIETLSCPSREYYDLNLTPFFSEGYLKYCEYQRDSCGTILEDFRVGARNQFKLVHNPKAYKRNFEIYNIASNGYIHTGKGKHMRPMFDEAFDKFDENMFSSVFLMKYGKFSFYNGGDICGGSFPSFEAKNRDFESQIADLIGGHVTMIKPDHHGWKDSVNPYFLNILSPDIVVIMCSQTQHPYWESFLRLIDPLSKGYPRKIYFTTDASRARMGKELWYKLAEYELNQPAGSDETRAKAEATIDDGLASRISDMLWSHVEPAVGHIVVRVYPGGDAYQVFVLDANGIDYKILLKSEIIYL